MTEAARIALDAAKISTHTLRKEGDVENKDFDEERLISTHTLRKEGDVCHFKPAHLAVISTHTLRKEGDGLDLGAIRRDYAISTHTLRKEGDFCFAVSI